MASFRDLLRQTKARDHRGRHRRGGPPAPAARHGAARRPRAGRVRPGRAPGCGAHPPRPPREPDRGPRARPRRPDRRLLRRWRPVRVRGQDAARARLHGRGVDGRRLQQVEGRRAGVEQARDAVRPTSATATSATSCCPRWASRARPSCSKSRVLLLGAGGLGSPAALYLAGGRRRHDRHRRHGRGRRLEPPAPDPAQPRPDRRAQGGLRQEDADRDEPRRGRRRLRHPALGATT